ncbi:MAG TPA: hypothetical protein VK337_18180 [Xanthobacteraceae bacterium]|nr:hypothetical protein [Xanthobacteraceae bacterium]
MPAPADAWAFADMLIVSRTAAAAAKVIATFLIDPPTYCVDAKVDEWCKHRVTSGILGRSGAVVETVVWVMQRMQGQDPVTSAASGMQHRNNRRMEAVAKIGRRKCRHDAMCENF